jgi:hypothetical protein
MIFNDGKAVTFVIFCADILYEFFGGLEGYEIV